MSYIEYTVRVWSSGYKYWHLNGKLHREDGPAVEWADGTKEWWLNGKRVKEKDVMGPKDDCEGKVVEIEGKKYRLTSIKE